MKEFTIVTQQFENEVEEEASRIVKKGLSTPYEAINIARKTIMSRRRYKIEKEK